MSAELGLPVVLAHTSAPLTESCARRLDSARQVAAEDLPVGDTAAGELMT
jgi:hypothetical protein